MSFKKSLLIASIVFIACISHAQNTMINVLDSGKKTSIRGLSVVDDNIVWASGSNGTVARSVDGGKTFEWLTVTGYEKRDFRDIEAFDKNTAIIMGIAEPAIILKTKDGGKSWNKVFEDSTKGMFLDAMDFKDIKNGIVVGDPINEKLFLVGTNNKGDSWDKAYTMPVSNNNQGCFASSGTNILLLKNGDYRIVSGGIVSQFLSRSDRKELPLKNGKETTGVNSIDTWNEKEFVVVGGDFTDDKDTTGNCALSNDAGQTWHKPTTPPHGYRSCVEYITKDKLITCGTSGVDISNDGGMNWQLISPQSFHVCQKAKKGNKVFLAGGNGKIAMLVMK